MPDTSKVEVLFYKASNGAIFCCKLTSDMGGNESQFEPTARRGKYYSKTRKPEGCRVNLSCR